jgi:transcription elongation factor GreA-like protein
MKFKICKREVLMGHFTTGNTVYHAEFGIGKIVNMEDNRLAVNFAKAGVKYFSPSEAGEVLSLDPLQEEEQIMDSTDIKEVIREILKEEGMIGTTSIGKKWEGGELILKPVRSDLKEKTVPIENFFHKVVMIRDRLRVLEQHINSSKSLSESEKLNLQQHITRCYGSLTTFNIFFDNKEDWFIGEKQGSKE